MIWSTFKEKKVGKDEGGLICFTTERRGRSCLMSSSSLHIQIRFSAESEGKRSGGLRRVQIEAIFEENRGGVFPEKYNRIARWGEVSL